MNDRDDPVWFHPVLYTAPVFWTIDYWSESAKQWDGIKAATPLADRPSVEIQAGLNATLVDILEAACYGLEIGPGPEMINHGLTPRSEFYRFAFVEPEEDKYGIDPQSGYAWPSQLPAPDIDGNISLIPAKNVTVRQLMAASQLGLIRGDVTRPYVYPVRPQGSGQVVVEISTIAPEIVRAALHAVAGIENANVWLINGGEKVLHLADVWTSQHPIETSGLVVGTKRAHSKLRDWFKRDDSGT